MIPFGWRWSGPLVGFLAAAATTAPAQDTAAQAALALAQGRPWAATALLRPVVADQTRADPTIRLLAARAAAAWGGWNGVAALLANQAWPDSATEGLARELLGRAALERRADREAVEHLRAAIPRSSSPHLRAIRLALLARAFDRMEERDSAATHYAGAARLLPESADWLRLRLAALTPDSASRQRIYRSISVEPARSRVAWVEAAARERTGDPAGAAARYDALGARLDAIRIRLALPPTDSARTAARRSLVALLSSPLSPADSRSAIALLDQQPGTLAPAEQLAAARRAAAIGSADRAVRGFSAARSVPGFGDADRLRHGMSLAQLGRHPEAIAQFESIQSPAQAGAAAYQRARAVLVQSGSAAALAALLAVPAAAPADIASASVALFLAGDLVADQADFRTARVHYQRVATEYPTSSHAPRALLEVGTLSYLLGEMAAALEAFQSVAERYPEREEGSAGLYWAGRVELEGGAEASARARWRTLIAAVPHSYYALAAARRLGEPAWAPDTATTAVPVPAGTLATLARVALLDSLGLVRELEFELDYLATPAGTPPADRVATAAALAEAGHAARSLALAQRALAAGAPPTRTLYLLLFPIPEPAVFTDIVAARGLDPWLAAGLIKQESGFNPRARSAADARGLMQVLPSVGAQLARRLGWPEWNGVLLYQPEVSLTLGTLHLEEMRQRYPDPVRFLAAYNAGGTRVQRWDVRPGVLADPELYLEMIPYLETRNYVRRVLRNAEFYRALYEK